MTDQTAVSTGFKVVATSLLTHAAPTVQRLLVLQFPIASTPRPAHVLVQVGDRRVTQDLGAIPPGETMAQVLVPEVAGLTGGNVRLTIGEESWTSPFSLAPARP